MESSDSGCVYFVGVFVHLVNSTISGAVFKAKLVDWLVNQTGTVVI